MIALEGGCAPAAHTDGILRLAWRSAFCAAAVLTVRGAIVPVALARAAATPADAVAAPGPCQKAGVQARSSAGSRRPLAGCGAGRGRGRRYNTRSTSEAAAACLRVLLGEPAPQPDPFAASWPLKESAAAIHATARAQAPYW